MVILYSFLGYKQTGRWVAALEMQDDVEAILPFSFMHLEFVAIICNTGRVNIIVILLYVVIARVRCYNF